MACTIVWRNTFSTAQRSAAWATLVVGSGPGPDRQAQSAEDQGRQEGHEHQGDEQLDQREAGLAGAQRTAHEPVPWRPSRTVSSRTSRFCQPSLQPTVTTTRWPNRPPGPPP